MGKAINLVENFKVEKVIFNCGEFNELEQELIKVLNKKKIPHYSCIKELNIDDNKLYFLNNKDYGNENDNSSVIYTEFNNHKFLFMGDAGIEVEEDLLEKYNLKDIDVLKVGHHGSKTSSSKNFIDEINPKYSIISVGKNNRYGHPNDCVLDNLKNSKIYRTDEDEINYYISLVNDRNISYRKLSELIKDNEYSRIDENLRKINQDKAIGTIICKQDNKYIIKYCSDDRIIAREYELV